VKGAAEHRKFVRAVNNRDVVAAEVVMRKHLDRTAQRVKTETRRGRRATG
jgi:DNA-binding GntR family transcriptional regulator